MEVKILPSGQESRSLSFKQIIYVGYQKVLPAKSQIKPSSEVERNRRSYFGEVVREVLSDEKVFGQSPENRDGATRIFLACSKQRTRGAKNNHPKVEGCIHRPWGGQPGSWEEGELEGKRRGEG